MAEGVNALFDAAVWRPALEKYGAVTHLSVSIYDVDARVVCGPVPSSPLFSFFAEQHSDPGLFDACARRCLAPDDESSSVLIDTQYGLAVVGTRLRLEGTVVAVAVAGYALIDFTKSAAVAQLARQSGVSFRLLWDLARRQQPIPPRRLVLYGELLQVLGDTLLRENHRTRQFEEIAAQLTVLAAAKDDFLAMLSHELRTPLTPIIGWARLLKSAAENDRVAHAADVIERNAALQVRLVEDLIELARGRRGTLSLAWQPVDLREVLRGALEAIAAAAAAKEIAVQFADHAGPLPARADADRLQQVFRNVLLNAVKFTPPGGRVTVTSSIDGGRAAIEIVDSGAGIRADFLPNVFDMFRQQEDTAARSQGGLGIGLALVKLLTEAHGGTVSIASEGIGRGTTVVIRLPLIGNAGSDSERAIAVAAPRV